MQIIHWGFTVKYLKNMNGEWVFRIYGERGQRVFKDTVTLSQAKEEINVYIRSSLKYPARTFTQWIQQVTGRNWNMVQHTSNAKQRDSYFKMYSDYCAVNFQPVDFDYEF